MEKYTILSQGNRICMFDKQYGIDLSLKDELLDKSFSTIINKVGIFFTSKNEKVMSCINEYLTFFKLSNFYGPVIFIKIQEMEDKMQETENVFWISQREHIKKGKEKNNFIYKFYDSLMLVNAGFQYIELYISQKDKLEYIMPLLIKIIEGLVIENHLGLGLFPIHAAMVKLDEQNCVVILGDSQSGKTTTASLFEKYKTRYTVLSDDIVFLDHQGRAISFSQYRKWMDGNVDSSEITFREKIEAGEFKVLYRYIEKYQSISYSPFNVTALIFPEIVAGRRDCNVMYLGPGEAGNKLYSLFSAYPNEWFVFSEFNTLLAYEKIMQLKEIPSYVFSHVYESDNSDLIRKWEEIYETNYE